MNVSKTLASTVAALAVVGSIGIAYAQTTTSDTTSTPSTQSMDPNNRPLSSPSTMSNDTSAMPSSSTGGNSSTLSTDPAPQADRG